MIVVVIASAAVPFARTGGGADAAGALDRLGPAASLVGPVAGPNVVASPIGGPADRDRDARHPRDGADDPDRCERFVGFTRAALGAVLLAARRAGWCGRGGLGSRLDNEILGRRRAAG